MRWLNQFTQQMKFLWYFIGLFCVVEIINLLSGRVLNQYSILPRNLDSIGYIFTAPFLHADTAHFLSNLVTLIVFAFLVMQFVRKSNGSASRNAIRFFTLSLIIITLTGLCVWVLARPAYHLGASGLIYGYFGFLLVAGWLQKRVSLLLISVMVAVLYGSIIWGALPTHSYISWESHLFGFIVGLVSAWGMTKFKT